MLRLGYDVCRYEGWVSPLAQDYNLSGASEKIYGTVKGDKLFGCGDEQVPRPDDLFHPHHGSGSISQRSNRLSAADTKDAAYTKRTRCGQYLRGRVGRDDCNFGNAGHLRGNHSHEQRGRKRVAASGNITSY